MTFRKTAVKESSYSVAEYETDLTNGRQSFMLLSTLIDDKWRHNVVKVSVETTSRSVKMD